MEEVDCEEALEVLAAEADLVRVDLAVVVAEAELWLVVPLDLAAPEEAVDDNPMVT